MSNPKSNGVGDGDLLDDELSRLAHANAGEWLDLELLRSAVEREIGLERGLSGYLRSRSSALRASLALVVFALLSALAFTHPRLDLASYPLPRMLLVLGVELFMIACGFALVLWPLQRPLPPSWVARVYPALALLALIVLYALPDAHTQHSASFAHGISFATQLRRTLPCGTIGLVHGALVYALLAALDRGGGARSGAFVLVSGLGANFHLQLVCPMTSPEHLLLGHLGILLLLAAAIVWLRRGAR